MSQINKVAPPAAGSDFTQSIGFGDHMLSVQRYGSLKTQWWTEGETAWKQLPEFQDLSSDFNLLGEYNPASGNYAIGIDFSRDIVFFGSYYTVGLVSCDFDSDGVITPITNLSLSTNLFGKIGVDEVNRLLFATSGYNLYCFGYDEDGNNLILLDTSTYPSSALDLDIDPVKNFVFVANRTTSVGLASFSYIPSGINKGQITQVHNYATSNHGYSSVVIDIVNQKLFACHDYMNSPVGIEILSYDNSAIISLVNTAAPTSGQDYGLSVTVDLTKRLIFMSHPYSWPDIKLASFSFDLSYNITPLVDVTVTGDGNSSIDTEKQYVLIVSNNGLAVSMHYNDAGTTLTQVDSRGVESTGWFCMAHPAYDFLFISTQWNGLQSYSYLSYIERDWQTFCVLEGELYGSAHGNLVRLDYVGPGWSTTKICDYKSSGVIEDNINSMTVYDSRIYGTGGGLLFKVNDSLDAWETVVASIYPGPPWSVSYMSYLTAFNGRLYGTSSSYTFRLNVAGDAWELAIGSTGGSTLRFSVNKERFYMTASGGWPSILYVLNDTEDDWIPLAGIGSYTISELVTDENGFLYIGTYASGYGSTGSVNMYFENKSVLRWLGTPVDPGGLAAAIHAPAVVNGKVYFCGGGSLFRVDTTFPCVTNIFLWEKDQYFYGWVGPGMGISYPWTEWSQSEENICVDTVHLARSADGITWDQLATTELTGPQWQTPYNSRSYKKNNYAPLTIWADFDGYLYSGANRLTEAVGSYATISRTFDGTTWNEVFYLSALRSTVRSFIVFEGNLYAAVEVMVAGEGHNSTHTISRIYRTSDGVTWDLIKTFDDGYGTFSVVDSFVEYDDKLYMTMNQYIYVSSDGINWDNTQGFLGTQWSDRNNPNALPKSDINKLYFYASDTD